MSGTQARWNTHSNFWYTDDGDKAILPTKRCKRASDRNSITAQLTIYHQVEIPRDSQNLPHTKNKYRPKRKRIPKEQRPLDRYVAIECRCDPACRPGNCVKNFSQNTKNEGEPQAVPLSNVEFNLENFLAFCDMSTPKVDNNQVRNTETYSPTISSPLNQINGLSPARTQNEETIMGYVDQLIANEHDDIEREVEERFARILENQRRACDNIIITINDSQDVFDNVEVLDDSVEMVGFSDAPVSTSSNAFTSDEVMVLSNNDSDVEIVDGPCTSTNVDITRKRRVQSSRLRSGKRMRKDSELMKPEPDTINPPVDQDSILGSRECSICLDQLQGKDISSTTCGHVFCTACITHVVKTSKTCPNCRTKLTLKKIHPLFL